MSKGVFNGLIMVAVVALTASVFFFLGIEYGTAMNSLSNDGSVVLSVEQQETTRPAPPPLGSISLNSATASQLMTVPGIGEYYAQRIIAYREVNGAFTALEQLMEIEGIGETRYQSWSPYFTLN